MPIVLKSGSLNLLEPSGPVQACNGIAFYINPNKMHKSQSLFYLTTALRVSGVTITHLQEHKATVTTASGNRYTVLLSAAVVKLFHDRISSLSYTTAMYSTKVVPIV